MLDISFAISYIIPGCASIGEEIAQTALMLRAAIDLSCFSMCLLGMMRKVFEEERGLQED